MRSAAIFIILAVVIGCGCTRAVKVPPRKAERIPEAPMTMMIASWYGPDFHGKLTASGEVYDMYGMTAAHKTLPFGTILRLTNPDTGAAATITITDRGPFVPGRDIDLSYRVAKDIGVIGPGVLAVMVQYIGRDMKYAKYIKVSDAASSAYTIQIAAYEDIKSAERLKAVIIESHPGVFIMQAVVNGKVYYRVRVGRYTDKEKAMSEAKHFANEGYDTYVTPHD
ncbi:septal ring lytic transglycosylase RlpA family protein [Candidatus Magnetominusculus xianensis]|uniref:Probable endolytic peptidoglycan transglycosylase RlpA n=1 Tax=Candidatus Magnetominusculus xianensis TaxID=1748249 RepID=A0ABR5SJ71_9BACT|nr:septal ring lytic transglycosylase RlpA family protein [Candidatus Magnetominusculus xianensis]KWT94227.1 RlpA-like protein precursor [Candidatus Magnetominusculus xianensis]MBF0402992.1 septal ring lytic transglycosylase RlpA family protein [Nitrospirota bacterium]